MCICRIIFLTGASNNHNDYFLFFLSLFPFCALHRGGGGGLFEAMAGTNANTSPGGSPGARGSAQVL